MYEIRSASIDTDIFGVRNTIIVIYQESSFFDNGYNILSVSVYNNGMAFDISPAITTDTCLAIKDMIRCRKRPKFTLF